MANQTFNNRLSKAKLNNSANRRLFDLIPPDLQDDLLYDCWDDDPAVRQQQEENEEYWRRERDENVVGAWRTMWMVRILIDADRQARDEMRHVNVLFV
jgi:hypothetical protein